MAQKITFLFLMVLLFTCYVCSEFAILSYLPAFLVKCGLHLSKTDATNVLSIYLFAFASARLVTLFCTYHHIDFESIWLIILEKNYFPFFLCTSYRILAMFLAMKLKPTHILIVNLTFALISNSVLIMYAEKEQTVLTVAYGFLGKCKVMFTSLRLFSKH